MVSDDDDLFPFFRPLCDLPRPHLQMLLYIQRTKPSSSILPMIRMPRMLPLVSSTIQQLVELPTECTMAQSIAGPGQYCTKKNQMSPLVGLKPFEKKQRHHPCPCKAPHSAKADPVLGSLERIRIGERVPDRPPRSTVAKLFFELQTEALLLNNCHPIRSRALREESRSSLDDCEQRLTNTYALSEAAFYMVKKKIYII